MYRFAANLASKARYFSYYVTCFFFFFGVLCVGRVKDLILTNTHLFVCTVLQEPVPKRCVLYVCFFMYRLKMWYVLDCCFKWGCCRLVGGWIGVETMLQRISDLELKLELWCFKVLSSLLMLLKSLWVQRWNALSTPFVDILCLLCWIVCGIIAIWGCVVCFVCCSYR